VSFLWKTVGKDVVRTNRQCLGKLLWNCRLISYL